MVTKNEHIIGKLLIELDLRTPLSNEFNWEFLSSRTEEILFQTFDVKLGKQTDSNVIASMDILELELNLVIDTLCEESLLDTFSLALEKALKQLPKSMFVKNTGSKNSKTLQALFHYLKYGVLPWFAICTNKITFETVCTSALTPQSAKQLLEILKKKPIYFERLNSIFDSHFFTVFVHFLGVPVQYLTKPQYLRKALDICNIRRLSMASIKKLYWLALLNISTHRPIRQQLILDYLIASIIENSSSNGKIVKYGDLVSSKLNFPKTSIIKLINQRGDQLLRVKEALGTIPENNIEARKQQRYPIREIDYKKKNLKRTSEHSKDDATSTVTNSIKDFQTVCQISNKANREPFSKLLNSSENSRLLGNQVDTPIYLKHAGVILIHPFLERFFSTFQLLKGKEWRSQPCAKRAVQLLAYLTTGKNYCPEYDMILFKCMCGLPFKVLVDSYFEISEEESQEANKLLSMIITHWTALKETSIVGLRTGFFERDGKLEMTQDGNWTLYIEQKAQDILLSRLPWSLGIVRFRWLKNLIMTVWT